ncbi:MAG: hypothetical protein H6718_33925 [Polyangiaceae bacterium]|nr:hypothetical protein [Polyangiaceae bacterium]MCB9608452.1 hypothetical protein [Polyangiaceae bacterium]
MTGFWRCAAVLGLIGVCGGCVTEAADDSGTGGASGSGGSGQGAAGGAGSAASGGSANAGSGSGGSSNAGSGSGGSSSSGVGTPGCAPTVECAKACGDLACVDGCIASATEHGRQLFNAMGECGAAADCQDIYCTMSACPDEWDACRNDFGENGYFCFASGNYYVCDAPGSCEARAADGGNWGATEDEAVIRGLDNCTEHMANSIQIASTTAYEAGVVDSCVITQCSPQ